MPQPTSIRRSLLVNLIAAVLLLGAAIIGMTFVRTRGTMERISESLITQTLARSEVELRAFFDPVRRQLLELRDLSGAGLDNVAPEDLDDLLSSFMRGHGWVSATMIADERGSEHMLLRTGTEWRSRRTPAGDQERASEIRTWSDGAPDAVYSSEASDYDPTRRPWFRGAVDELATSASSAPVNWTEPYTFFTTGDPGITASVAFRDDESRLRVIGLDVALIDISNFVTALDVLGNGFAYVLSSNGSLVGLPRAGRFTDDEVLKQALLKRPDELDVPMARDIAAAFLGDDQNNEQATRFVSGNITWWGDLRRVPLSPDSDGAYLVLGVAVPEADLLEGVQEERLLIGALTLLVLGVAVGRAFGLARRYSQPLEALVIESERISTGDLEPGPPIQTNVAEVHRLARAHDTMRDGLRSLLQIEHDLKIARTIQENTYPEQLPTLDGFDLAAWSEPADQTGGDTYDVIGLHTTVGDTIALTNGRAGQAVLLLADATGHGIGPALSVTQVRAMLRIAVRMSSDLSTIANHINTQLCEDLPGGRFVTCWLGQLDSTTGTLTAVSGGQAPLLRYHAARDEFEVLSADSPPFGLFDVGPIEVPPPMTLEPGDIFAVMSDGIFEAADPSDEQFGEGRVQDQIRQHRDASAAELLNAIRQAERAFSQGAPAADDRTILIVKRT